MLFRIFTVYPQIKVTKQRIFVNDRRLPSNTLSIIKHLLGPSKRLTYDLRPLFDVFPLDAIDQLLQIIRNNEAKEYLLQRESMLQSMQRPQLSSTPRSVQRSVRRPSNYESRDRESLGDTDDEEYRPLSFTEKRKGFGVKKKNEKKNDFFKWHDFL